MKDFKSYLYVIVALSILGTSCVKMDEIETKRPVRSGNIIERPFTYRIAKELPGDALSEISLREENSDISLTKAPAGVIEDEAFNVWIFQFDGKTPDATLVGSPHYVDLTEPGPMVPLLESEGVTHRLVYIVNVNNSLYNWNMTSGISTYQNLLNKYQQLTSEDPTFGGNNMNLPMSGTDTCEINNLTELNPEFVRSVARVELNLSVKTLGGDFEVMSVQLCNVPDRMDWADALLTHPANEIYPYNGGYLDYKPVKEAAALPVDGGDTIKFQWYVPRNTQGVVHGNTSSTRKTAYAPSSATYFKIIAKDKTGDGNGTGVIFRLLPGANMIDDFNLIPNHKYTVNLKIVGLGDENSDSRVENFGEVNFLPNSNCYILNPPLAGMAPRVFNVPINRVNDYWGASGIGYGNQGGGPITSSDKWVVELYWQDLPDLVVAGTTRTDAITLKKTQGTGFSTDGTFSISVPAGIRPGNFSIAIYKADAAGNKNSNILWSWHFWVTDYNPYQIVSIKGDQWTYPVPGGQVERYGSPVFGYTSQVYSPVANNDYSFDPTLPITPTTPFAQSVMMDRFLGALDDQYLPGSARGALFYQFGRKDPIPGTINLYNINGQLLPTNVWNRNPVLYNDAAGNNVFYSIYNPLAFITGTYNWSNINESSFLWLDSKNLITNKTASDLEAKTGNFAKSFFDPCPSGWKVPIKDITLDFRKDITIMNPSRNLYIQIGDTFGGLYWPYVKVGSGYPVGGRIYYPTTGYRTGATAVNNPGVHGKSWTATLSSLTHAYELSVLTQVSNSNIGYYEGTDLRTQANTIRCIRE